MMISSAKISIVNVVFFLILATFPFCFGHLGVVKETHLHFYLHEIFAGPNATTASVVSQKNNSGQFTFGDISVFDDVLREGPEPTSKLIGHAEGIFTRTSQEITAFTLVANFVFDAGNHTGSTLAIVGRVVLGSMTREWSVVGGSGKFQLARGYALGKVLSTPTGTLRIEFDVDVMH